LVTITKLRRMHKGVAEGPLSLLPSLAVDAPVEE